MHLFAALSHYTLVGDDLEIAEYEVPAAVAGTDAAQKGSDPGRELLGGKGLGQVVVGAGFKPGDDVVGVGSGRDHHDRNIAVLAYRSTHLKAIDAGKHDVDEHNIGGGAGEQGQRVFAVVGFDDFPALILERELY